MTKLFEAHSHGGLGRRPHGELAARVAGPWLVGERDTLTNITPSHPEAGATVRAWEWPTFVPFGQHGLLRCSSTLPCLAKSVRKRSKLAYSAPRSESAAMSGRPDLELGRLPEFCPRKSRATTCLYGLKPGTLNALQ